MSGSAELAYEHNGRRIARAAFYAIACDPRRSVAVEACAGAGKTWMLVSRIVRALLDGCAPHEILAITFTKKAAGEMRERLHEWLADFATEPPEKLRLELSLRGVSDAALADGGLARRLQGLQHAVLTAGRPVQIRTFHGWFAALLRTAPLALLERLGLPAHYELLENDAQAVARTWRPFYAAVLADDSLREDFHAAVASYGRSQTLKALESALGRRIEFALADERGAVASAVQPWSSVWPDADPAAASPAEALLAHRTLLYAAASALGGASAKTFVAKGVELETAVTEGRADAACAALLTQKGEPRKFRDKVVGLPAIQAAQELAIGYLAAQAQQLAWEHQQRMARLTRVLLAEYAAVKRERGWIDMNDVEQAAQILLSDPILSGWVQQRLDAHVRHLLVDEFQDTNPLQWQALQAWLSAYAGAGGSAPGVFLVGDPKQSIYRFRRAEPQVFRAAQAFVVDGLGGDRLACDHTRRNAPAVIAVVNAAMGAAQATGEYAGFREHTTESTEAGAVQQLPAVPREGRAEDDGLMPAWRDSLTTPRVLPEETMRHRECRQAARWLAAQIAAGTPPREVMVLSRRRAALSAMEDALRDVAVPAQQPEKSDLCDAPEVQDIVALLDALVSPGHDLSLARALRSPLFGLDDADLVQIALARQRLQDGEAAADTSWFGVLQNEAAGLPLHIAATGPVLLRWQRWVARLPPHDAIDAIFHDGDVLARFAAAVPAALRDTMIARLRSLPGTALQIDGGRFATPYGFIRALKAGGVAAPVRTEPDAVRLLTVHGAKGLEADLVLMLDTDGQATRSETMGVLVDWPGEEAAPRSFVFLASESAPPPGVAAAVAAERIERQREEINGLYVAATRARKRLVLSSCEPHRPNPGSWWRRLDGLCEPVAPEPEAADVAAGAAAAEPSVAAADFLLPELPLLPAGVPIDWPLPPDLADDDGLEAPVDPHASDAGIGLAMHRLLEWTPDEDGAYTDAQQAAAGHEFALDAAQTEQAATLAQRIRQGEGRWAWDASEIDWQGSEVPLVHEGVSLRIDRLVRRRGTGEWWVLDYKSAASPERQPLLRAQLAGYRAAVRAASPGQTVHAAFLTGQGTVVLVGDEKAATPQNTPPAAPPPPAPAGSAQAELF